MFNHEYDCRSIGRNEVLLPINHNYNKICDILGFFKVKTQEILRGFFLLALKIKKPFKRACEMCVQCNYSHDAYCPIILSY